MAVTEKQKQYCMHNLVVMCIETLLKYTNKSEYELISEFSSSQTFEKLYDSKTRLWAEGPDYILSLYGKEKNLDFSFLEED